MIHLYFKTLLSLFLFTTLFDIAPSGYIPPRKGQHKQNTIGDVLQVQELTQLGKYICNDHANLLRRQVQAADIPISPTTVKQLLAEIKVIELKLLSILNGAQPPAPPPVATSDVFFVEVQTVVPLPFNSAIFPPNNNIPTTTTTTWITVTETVQPQLNSVINEVTTLSSAILDTAQVSSMLLQYSPPTTLAIATDISPPTMSTLAADISLPSAPVAIPPVGDQNLSTDSVSTNRNKYKFNPQSSKNVAVYYGQSPATATTPLTSQCADPSIDIVILAFLVNQLDGGKYPSINFGAVCGGQTQKMMKEAPGLLWCPDLAKQIDTCQSKYGKKVFLSVGGAVSQISFSGDDQAKDLAGVIWGLFGPVGNEDLDLRPFGTVEVDGFDIDNEDNHPQHFENLALTLRNHFSKTTKKTYYLSSAPQCPFPDASDPMPLILLCDFVWVQFYNNPGCEIGSAGFHDSVQQWSQALATSTMVTKPRFYLGAPAWSAAGPTAYQGIGSPKGMKHIVEGVGEMKMENFGGVMFWDGSEGVLNKEDGKDIIDWAKEGLR